MTDDEKRAHEKLGYARGYAAGRKWVKREHTADRRRAEASAQWNRCYLALLPTAMQVDGWQMGGKPVTTTDDRVRLAKAWADHAAPNLRSAR